MTRYAENRCSHITSESFDADVWDVICAARIRYRTGVDKSEWYVVLRQYCGYKGNGVWLKRRMERIADEWLQLHPSWASRQGLIQQLQE